VVDKDSDGSSADYLNGPGIDSQLRQSSSLAGSLYFLQNHLGSTAALTDTAGNVVERTQYEPFGDSAGSAATRYGYTGRERDPTTGLVYYRARWYDPQQGRFLREDPIGITLTKFTSFGARDYEAETGMLTAKDLVLIASESTNLYEYVLNDPVNQTDPLGTQLIRRLPGESDLDFIKRRNRLQNARVEEAAKRAVKALKDLAQGLAKGAKQEVKCEILFFEGLINAEFKELECRSKGQTYDPHWGFCVQPSS